MMKLPFAKDPNDPFFIAASTPLQGIGLSPEDLYVIYRHVCDHFEPIALGCGEFWYEFSQEDVVDISSPDKNLYALVHLRLGKQFHSRHQAEQFWLEASKSVHVRTTLNHFFNSLIRMLKEKR